MKTRMKQLLALLEERVPAKTPEEVEFCELSIREEIARIKAYHVGDFRAARMWISSQRRRFRRDCRAEEGMCNQHNFVATLWNMERCEEDIYLLGFNYGH